VRGKVHTNNIESFWALLKRGIIGTCHNVGKGYLPLYLKRVHVPPQQQTERGNLHAVRLIVLAKKTTLNRSRPH